MALPVSADVPFLKVSDPSFSVRAREVREARDRSWYARTPYGLAVLRYADVSALMKDHRLKQGSARWPQHNGVSGRWADWWSRILLNLEGDDHARLRRLSNPAFSPKLISALQPKFQSIANDLIDKFAEKGHCEFISAFSEPYATRVITLLLGTAEEDAEALARWSGAMGLALGVTFKRDLDKIHDALDNFFAYADKLIEERRSNPRDDFVSRLVTARFNEDKLSHQELRDMIVLLIFGGIDTTRNQLGLAMERFIEHSDQWKLLAARPDLAGNAVEEVMRTRPTVTWVTREATVDFSYNGVDIEKGTTIHLFSEAAGTDPRAMSETGFDIREKKPPHFGFGGGMHHCLGHFIARGDMSEALKLLAQRLPRLDYDGSPEWLPDSGNTGAVRFPIKFESGH